MYLDDKNSERWFDLFSKGRFVDAFLLKKLYLECFLGEVDTAYVSMDVLINRLKALIWLGELDSAQDALAFVPISQLSNKEAALFSIVRDNVNVLLGYVDGIPGSLNGCKVIIFGPSPLNEHLDFENLSCDILISLNGANQKSKPPAFGVSYNKHIIYCSGEFFRGNFADVNSWLLSNKIDATVVNGFRRDKYAFCLDDNVSDRIRSPYPFLLGPDAALLGIPRALYDVLHQGATKVLVLNADFYVGYPFHMTGYPVSVTNWVELAKSWAIHDVAFNYSLSSMMVNNNLFSDSTRFNQVLNIGVVDYLRSLEDVFQKFSS